MLKYIGAAIVLVSTIYVLGCGETNMFSKKEYIVGKDIAVKDIKDFYYTIDASTNPPKFQRFRFTNKSGKYFFYHEKREGNTWPLTEKHITIAGRLELTAEQWTEFYSCVDKGKVTKRQDDANSGGRGPWLFLYWTNDKKIYQVFNFASLEQKRKFENLCLNLKTNNNKK